jgi:hypothetical protein
MPCTSGRKLAVFGIALLAVALPGCSHRQDDRGALRREAATVPRPGDTSSNPPGAAAGEVEDCPEEAVG